MESKASLPLYDPAINAPGSINSSAALARIGTFRQLLSTVVKLGVWETARQKNAHLPAARGYGGGGGRHGHPEEHDSDNEEDEDEEEEENDRSQFAVLHPVGQLVMIESRSHDVSSFNVNADMLAIFGDSRNRWLNYLKVPCDPPSPMKVPRLTMSPRLCALWQWKLCPPTSSPANPGTAPSAGGATTMSDPPFPADIQFMNLIIVQGTAGAEARRFMAVESFYEAASCVLHELINGYSVVFVGLMLKSEFENRMLAGKAYQICKTVDELRRWRQKDKDHHLAVGSGGSNVTSPSAAAAGGSSIGAAVRPGLGSRSASHSRIVDKEKDSRAAQLVADKTASKEILLADEPRRYLGIIC